MFADYQARVLQDYEEKKKSNRLSLNLTHPTAAKLKAECLLVCDKRFRQQDARMLSAFFEQQDNATAYRMAIKKTEADKLKPLNLLLQKKIERTSEKNIELLAWLIDFEPRPYQVRQDIMQRETVEGSGEMVDPKIPLGEFEPVNAAVRPADTRQEKNVDLEKEVHYSDRRTMMWPKAKGVLFALLMIALLGISYVVLYKRTTGAVLPNTLVSRGTYCMYWKGDHYQSVPCNYKPGDSMVVALDRSRLTGFKRILNYDTLTPHAIGKVWYIKLNGNLEFYTAGGLHPVYPERRLKPLTMYILNKYIKTSDFRNQLKQP